MDYNIYIDESGNTGNIEVCEDLTWNFKNQTHFALGAFYLAQDKVGCMEKDVINILHKHDIKLGTEIELKSKANYKFKNELLEEITKILLNNGSGFYFDIADKKFKVIMNIVEYCVYPYYIYDFIANRNDKVVVANFLYRTITQEQLKHYIDLCQCTNNKDRIVDELIEYLSLLVEHFNKNNHKSDSILNTIKYVNDHKSYNLKVENLLPIKDYNNKGTKESFLPNVDAFNNLVGTISKLKLGSNDCVSIYHDEQKQFSEVLLYWSSILEEYGVNKKTMKFCVSRDSILIQIADFCTGNIIRLFRKIIEKPYLEKNDRDLIKTIKPLLYNCNIVAPVYVQERFFETCGIKFTKTPLPFH